MISSVVARLESSEFLSSLCEQLEKEASIEVGCFVEGCSLPLTLEADTSEALEQLHQWLRDLSGVQLINAVCVYF